MSIIFHHYKILNEILDSKNNMFFFSKEKKDNNIINQNNSIILQNELEKWKTYYDILRKPNRDLLNQMLQSSSYKYSNAIDANGENYSPESLLMPCYLNNTN
jgi:hypothetical protein